jgi:HAD superfamily hydrolase (TIGR01549 family)
MADGKYVVFDFDGTIADTIDLSMRIYNKIAPEYDCKQVDPADRYILASRNAKELMREAGITSIKLTKMVLRIRKELGRHIHETEPVSGIIPALEEIRAAGYRLGVLTSNSRENVDRFFTHNFKPGTFDFIYSGRNIFGKDRVICRMLERENIPIDRVVYVGDETRDIEACKRAGIPLISVSWGLNRRESLAAMNPDKIADEPKELPGFVQLILGDR